jgi:hypothetical protein
VVGHKGESGNGARPSEGGGATVPTAPSSKGGGKVALEPPRLTLKPVEVTFDAKKDEESWSRATERHS